MELFKIIFCIVYTLIGIFTFIYYYKKTRDILNPFGIVIAIWCMVAGIANLNLSHLETQWNVVTYLVVILFPLMIMFVAEVGKINVFDRTRYDRIELSNCYILCSRFVFLICVVCAFVEFKAQGYSIGLFTDLDGVSDAKTTIQSVPIWHYGTIYLPYCSISAFYELCFSKIKSKTSILFLLIEFILPILHSLFIIVSRGTLLIIILGVVYIWSRKFKIKVSKLAAIIAFILAAFVLIMQLRVNYSGSLVYSVIEGHTIISVIYSYTALNFNNLTLLTQNGSSWTIINRTFGGITQLLGMYGWFKLPDTYMTVFFNALPICYYFYDDLGLIGVVLYTTIIFSVVKKLYNKCNVNQNYMILMASLQKAIWMSIFGNYFCQYRVTLFPYIVLAIMIKLMNVRFKPLTQTKLKRKAVYKWENTNLSSRIQ